MISLSVLINKLETETSYIIEEAKANEQEMPDELGKPKITIGYGPIRNSHPEVVTTFDLYEKNADDLVQSFYIKYICDVTDFRTVFINVYKILSSFNPNLPNDVNTGFCYVNGEPAGINNNTFWFISEWKINFPTNTLLT
jgi:hypothetical protein